MTTIPPEGSDAEAKAIVKEFRDNPAKYAHDFGACQRAFRKNIRLKYAAERAGVGVAAGSEDEARRINLHYRENGGRYIDSVRAVRAESVKFRADAARQRYSESTDGDVCYPGSEAEAFAIKMFHERTRAKYRDDSYSASQKRFRAALGGGVLRYADLSDMFLQPNSPAEFVAFAEWFWPRKKNYIGSADVALAAFRESYAK